MIIPIMDELYLVVRYGTQSIPDIRSIRRVTTWHKIWRTCKCFNQTNKQAATFTFTKNRDCIHLSKKHFVHFDKIGIFVVYEPHLQRQDSG